MSRPVPSRHALRHLTRLCAEPSSPLKTTPIFCTATRNPQHDRQSPHIRQLSTRPSGIRRIHTSTTTTNNTTPTTSSSPSSSSSNPPPPLPDTTTFYTLFPRTLASGPPPTGRFAISLPDLRREFLALQSLYHPDKYHPPPAPSSSSSSSTTPTPSPTNLIALSTLLNNAYRTLSSPILRAQYLLQQNHDIDVTSEDNSANTTDPQTLMEVMEAQEAIEDASGEAEIEALKNENRGRIDETEAKLGVAFERDDVETARRECVRLNYWMSLQQGLHDWEPGKEVRLVH